MLILARKKDESIMINEDIEIVILDIDEGKVRLGIKAPKSVKVHRKEVFETIVEANKAAIKSNISPNALKSLAEKIKK